MKVVLGKNGLSKTFQEDFFPFIKCPDCKDVADIGFVAHERGNDTTVVSQLYKTTGKKGGLWLHDRCAVAVYICRGCLKPIAVMNQG